MADASGANTNDSPSDDDKSAAKGVMQNLLDTMVRCEVSDGRLISGKMWCMDNFKNFILLNGQETRIGEGGVKQHRSLGPLVMVPGKYIVKIEASKAAVAEAKEALDVAEV
eukprot:TRINITY_DN18433_c0_g3_i1.p1 TRINITY_DN18433_c0_g3~~TRINITY_DN18433_c0_g3_i1.p1  ORF type:complete len:111 (-),score=27.09 TRINITY_DN18433_c0_g3_i1:181-513(-)